MELRSKEIWATWSRVSCATDARSLEDGYEADRGSPSHTPAPQTFRAWGKREQNFVWQTFIQVWPSKTQRNTWDYSQYSRNNMYNQARADRVKLCVSRFTFLLPMLAELLGQIRKIDSTMERFLSFEANYFNGTVHCKTNGKLLLSKVHEARAQKNTWDYLPYSQAVVNLGPDPCPFKFYVVSLVLYS